VPLVVLDPVVLVNTGKVPEGPSAKLLTLLAYGRAVEYLDEGAHTEAQVRQQARARKALKQGIPPSGRTSGLCLATSTTLIDRVVRRIGRLRDSEDLELDAGIVAAAVSVHAARLVTGDWDSIPDYTATGDTDANVSIHTALRAGAPLVVTKLLDACEPETSTMYYPLHPGQDYPLGATRAVHFDLLVRALCQEFDFHAIDARVLEQIAPTGAHRPTSASTAGSASPAAT
jgi:predicted nucleic acid-binding protein